MTEADWRMKALADFFGATFVRVDEDGEPMTTNDAAAETTREADRAVRESDAVHAVHEAIVNNAPDWIIDREDGELFDMARAALAAVRELDADAVERAAKALNQCLWDEGRSMGHWDELSDMAKDVYRRRARAALTAAAVPTVQAAAGDDLDAMLNNIHPNATASLQFIQPYLTTDPEPYWQAHVSVPTGGLTGFQKHRGTGATRMAAITDAVRQAKENGDG